MRFGLKQLFIIIAIILFLVISIALFNASKPPVDKKLSQNPFLSSQNLSLAESPGSTTVSNVASEPTNTNGQSVLYTNPTYGFSFMYPPGYKAREVKTDGYDIIIVEGKDSSNGFQIAVSPFDGELTPAEVGSRMISGVNVANPKAITLDDKAHGFMFGTNDPAFNGASFEAWFTYGGHLFQISTFGKNESLVQGILGMWRFEIGD